jgi:diguanylate cyclase (GGDEF)-like protein/PAS domain S-box-containing protein
MSGETILVVDDNRQIADFMAGKVLRNMGFETLVAYNGKTALEIIRVRPISLMLLDLQLPDTTGLELLRKLHIEGHSVPTILVTAHGSEEIAVDAFRLGVQEYLNKPVDTDLLFKAVTRALAESRLRKEKEVLNTQLRDQISWLTVLSKIGQSVTSTLELDEVLRRIVEAGVLLTKAEEGFLALLDSETGQIYLRAVKNIDQARSKTMRLPVSDSLVGSVITTGKPLRISQTKEDAPLKVSTGFLVHSLLHVPIFSKGRAIGVLSVDNHTTRQMFREIDEALLTSLGDYAAVAIENASLYQQAQQEIVERARIEQALRESEERYALAVRGANDGIWDWDLKKNTVYYSPRWKAMLGYDDDGVGVTPNEWFNRIHPEDLDRTKLDIFYHYRGATNHFENEHRMLHKDGTYHWMQSRGIAVWDTDGTPCRMVGSLTDITDRKSAEQKLSHDAFHDTLTDLPNRTLFMDRLSLAVERAKRREDFLFAVLFLDLDRFKDINDSLGHLTGDQLLIAIAKMLGEDLRSTDTVARLGGDEFVILLEDIIDISDATHVADRIQEKLTRSIKLSDREVFVTTSIGIVLSMTGYQRPEDVLRDADIAMYRAKAQGRARYEIFDLAMRDRIMDRISLETDLRQAFERNELLMYYQPIVSIMDNRIIGFEALVRWQHPERGLLSPTEFIPMAEESGLILSIGRWVIREACTQMREWLTDFCTEPPLTISVNLSGKQVAQPELYDQIEEILKETSLDPHSLKLEITESAIMDNIDFAVQVFTRLQSLGVQIQVDDFGIGYSSLNYLSHFPINTLKIDRTFVRNMTKDNNYLKIVQAIIMLAHGLGMTVIAEGVETEAQLSQIKALGCELAQGFYISKPWDVQGIKQLLSQTFAGDNRFSNRSAKTLEVLRRST